MDLAETWLHLRKQAERTSRHEEYRLRPLDWIVEMLGVPRESLQWSLNPGYDTHVWDGTPDPLVAMLDSLANGNDTAVESATGTGKSYVAACVVLWFLACWVDARVFTFAPTAKQLERYIWAEITKLWPRFLRLFPQAQLNHLAIYMQPGNKSWGAWGFPVGVRAGEDVAVNAAGMHGKDMLMIYEEMPGIHDAVVESGANTVTAPHNIRLGQGNPDHQQDTLHKFASLETTTAIRISALDHPNVVTKNANLVPGAVSLQSIAKRRAQYTESSPMYQRRVRGICPAQATDSLVMSEWIKAAQQRWIELEAMPITERQKIGQPAMGIDVAQSENGDHAATALGFGSYCFRIESEPCPNATVYAEQQFLQAFIYRVPLEFVGIDPIGVGAAALNHFRGKDGGSGTQSLGASQKPISGAERGDRAEEWTPDSNLFANLRAQMYWQARVDLQKNLLAVPPDPELEEELVTITYTADKGKVIMMPKDKLREKLGRSPNKMDAFVYWNFARPRSFEERQAISKFDKDNKHSGIDFKAKRGSMYAAPVIEEDEDTPRARPFRFSDTTGREEIL